MADILVDCVNETCPIPLIETRKAITAAICSRKMQYMFS